MTQADPRVRDMLLGGLAAAAATGRADPAPLDRPWPSWLRWTRRVGVGRLPFGLVVTAVAALIAVGATAGTFSLLRTEIPGAGPRTLLLISVVSAAPLVLVERHPLGAWRCVFAGMAFVTVGDRLTVPFVPAASLVAVTALFAVALRCRLDITVGATLISIAGAWVKGAPVLGAALLVLLPVLAGAVLRVRRTSGARLAAQERRHQEAEAVLTERQRIARELHDVVAHHMSMIAIQAEAAPYKVTGLPAETRGDLAEIRATALDALVEMRRVLGVLRSEDGAQTAPQPGLDRLGDLVEGARGTGLTVRAETSGDLASLPPGIGLTAYRITQEALSNVMRHAPGALVDLRAEHRAGTLTLSVVNGPAETGRARTPSPPGAGHGLVGMRERASMLGGTLTAAATDAGGFGVTATLPVPGPGETA
ncbi:sensor histidine kinase [Actinomadura flavalba]|uniref:sensor histidine kinase n=1 Tax=Actinomadura flavalba TaxID=1120938 RepID=UPI000477029E|nr:sensor histidine kinase [Actinomadura flavalba]